MTDTLTNGLTEAALRALVHKELKLRRERDDLRERHKSARNHIKTFGVDLKNFDAAITEMLADDGGARFVSKLSEQHRLMKMLDLPVAKNFAAGDQLALPLDTPKKDGRSQTVSAAFRRGANMHLGGFEEADNPYSVNTAEGQDWLEGYRFGEEQLSKGLKDIKALEKGETPDDGAAAKGTIPAKAPPKAKSFAGEPIADAPAAKAEGAPAKTKKRAKRVKRA